MRCKDRNAQPPDTVGLNRKPAFARHGFEDRFYPGASLHELIRSEVTDVSSPNGQDIFTKQCKFLVHHLLHHGSRKHPRKIIVFKGGHKRHGTGCNDHIFRIDEIDLLRADIFHRNTSVFQDVPYR